MRRHAFVTAAVAPMLVLPLMSVAADADTTSPFDAANLKGSCAALELTVTTGYSFIVQPDIQVPRAGTAVVEGESEAIASPADPGDSVDGLAALGIPEAEGYMTNGYPGAPPPFAGKGLSTLPPPLNSVGQALVTNPFNQALTYPYEHADAGYPNAQSSGPQTATLAGTPNVTAGDPSGIFTLDAATASATAGDGTAVADSGLGAATAGSVPGVPLGVASLPAFGVSVGRVSAHSEAHVLANEVTEDASCTLDDVEVAVPGSAALHIGAVVATVHAQRVIGAPRATALESIEFSGVTLNGQGATLNQDGLSVAGHTITTLPTATTPAPPPGLPASAGPVPTTPPTVSVTGTRVTSTQPTPDEAVIAATGATVTITSTTPVPNAIPPTGVSATPTVYTLNIASLAGEAYGLAASPVTAPAAGPGSASTGVAGALGSALGSLGRLGSPGFAGVTHLHAGRPGSPASLASIAVTPVQRAIVLVVSSLLELFLLAGVIRNYLRGRRHVTAPVVTTDVP